jgi:hypothetical protein
MLAPPHPHFSYFPATHSVPGVQASNASLLLVTSGGSAHTFGTWTQLHAGLTYPSYFMVFRMTGVRTSADAITSTTLNAWCDIGIGPDNANVTVIAEKLGCPNSQGLGALYWLPLYVPADTPIWARHQNTAASAKCYVSAAFNGGQMNPGSFPFTTRIVAIGATSASTTGTAGGSGTSNVEGGWIQMTASSAEDYMGLMMSPQFNVDTSMTTALMTCGDVGFGSSGNEDAVGQNIMYGHIFTANEQRESVSFPAFCGIKAGSRIVARVSSSLSTADASESIIVYGLTH